MVAKSVAQFDAPIINGGALPPAVPGLGVAVNVEALGKPLAVYGAD